jgi:hypothetical protein
MSFSTINTIQLIDEYKKNIPVKVFYLHDPYNLKTAQKALDFLTDLLKKSSGNEIQFQNYSEMMYFMNYSEYLTNMNELPIISANNDQLLDHILKIRNISKALIGETYEQNIPLNAIWRFKDVLVMNNNWQRKKGHIEIPNSIYGEIRQKTQPYLEALSSYPISIQKSFADVLYKMNDPKKLLDEAILKNDEKIALFINKVKKKFEDRLKYLDNVYFSFSLIDLSNGEYKALYNLYEWSNTPIDSIYKINNPDIDKVLNQMIANQKESNRRKKLTEQQKKEEEEKEKKKKEEEKKMKEKEEEVQLENKRNEIEQIARDGKKIYTINEALRNFSEPLSIDDSSNYESQIDNTIPKVENTLSFIENLLDNPK